MINKSIHGHGNKCYEAIKGLARANMKGEVGDKVR